VASNGSADLPGQGLTLGAPLHMSERRIDLREGDQ
jgi:hypothetical protein